jgi:hypothetical protein
METWGGKTSKKLRRAHPSFAFELDFVEAERILAGRDHGRLVRPENGSGFSTSARHDRRAEDFQVALFFGIVAEDGKTSRPWIEGANFPFDHFRGFGPIDPALLALQLWRVAGAR